MRIILHGIWVKYGGNPNKCNKYIYTDRGFIVYGGFVMELV